MVCLATKKPNMWKYFFKQLALGGFYSSLKQLQSTPLTFYWRSLLPPTPSSPPAPFEQSTAAPSLLDSCESLFSSSPPLPLRPLLNDEALPVAPPLLLISSAAAKPWSPWSTALRSPCSLSLSSPPPVLPLCPWLYARSVKTAWFSPPPRPRRFLLLISSSLRLSSRLIHHLEKWKE